MCKSLLFTGGQGQTISEWAEPRHFSLQSSRGARSSRQAILYDYNNKAMKNKSRKQFPTCSQNWLPPCNNYRTIKWNVSGQYMYYSVFSRETEPIGLIDFKHWLMQISKQGFPWSSVIKESACNSGDLGSIPGLGRSPKEGNGDPLQYSCLENPMDRGAW